MKHPPPLHIFFAPSPLKNDVIYGWSLGLITPTLLHKGSFNNHVDIILHFFDHPPTSVGNLYVLSVDKNGKP